MNCPLILFSLVIISNQFETIMSNLIFNETTTNTFAPNYNVMIGYVLIGTIFIVFPILLCLCCGCKSSQSYEPELNDEVIRQSKREWVKSPKQDMVLLSVSRQERPRMTNRSNLTNQNRIVTSAGVRSHNSQSKVVRGSSTAYWWKHFMIVSLSLLWSVSLLIKIWSN